MIRPVYLNAKVYDLPSLGLEVYTAQYQPTDRPIEDRISIDFTDERAIIGIYDGHRGPWAAEYVAAQLPKRILATGEASDVPRVFEDLDLAVMDDFKRAVEEAKPSVTDRCTAWVRDKLAFGRTGTTVISKRSIDLEMASRRVMSGTTALIADLTRARPPRLYNAGDSRGFVYDASRQVMHVTVDHNARSPSESIRVERGHPGEAHLFTGGRLFGQQLATRAFGDGHYKLPLASHRRHINILSRYAKPGSVPMSQMYDALFHDYLTPPYLTARPDELEGVSADFDMGSNSSNVIVLATDGLWDVATPDRVREVISQVRTTGRLTVSDGNVAKEVLDAILQEGQTRPGDDVSIAVVVNAGV